MVSLVALSEVFSLEAFEPLRRRNGGEGCRRSEPRFTEKGLRYGVLPRDRFCFKARNAVGSTSAETADLGELSGLLDLSWSMNRDVTYESQLEQRCFATSQDRAYVQ